MELQQESCIRQASSVLKDGHVMEAAEAWGGGIRWATWGRSTRVRPNKSWLRVCVPGPARLDSTWLDCLTAWLGLQGMPSSGWLAGWLTGLLAGWSIVVKQISLPSGSTLFATQIFILVECRHSQLVQPEPKSEPEPAVAKRCKPNQKETKAAELTKLLHFPHVAATAKSA